MKRTVLRHIIILAVVLAVCFACGGCPVLFVTGIPCPACGVTRAWLSLLCGNIAGAFTYHPLFLLLPVLLLYAIHSRLLPQRLRTKGIRAAVIGCAVAVFSVWIIRLCTGDPSIPIRIHEGLISLLIDKALKL